MLLTWSTIACYDEENMKQRISAIIDDPFIQHNAVFFLGSLAVAIINYVYHPILSHFLSIQNFGDLEALIATYSQIGIITGIFGKIVINNISHKNQNTTSDHSGAIQQLYTCGLIVMTIVVGIILIKSSSVVTAFHFQSYSSLIVLAGLALLSVPATFQTSALQGAQRFSSTIGTNFLFAAGKLICAVILVLLGCSVSGAIGALAISQLITIIYTHKKSKKYFSMFSIKTIKWKFIIREIPYAFLILSATGLVTILYTSDIIFVKRFFNAHDAGLYSGISTISNILFFATTSVAGVLLPSITRQRSFDENHVSLIKALAITTILGISGLSIFYLFPHAIISLFIGNSYSSFSNYLPKISIMIFLVSLINIFMVFFLALRDYTLTIISLMGLCVLAFSLSLFHSSISSIINGFLCSSSLTLLFLIGYYLYYWYQHMTTQNSSVNRF